MNFLVTSIGSMSAQFVISSIREHFPYSKIIGTDLYPADWSWIAKQVDSFQMLCKATDDNFIKNLLKISIQEKIDFILPLTDLEVDKLALNQGIFYAERIKLCISDLKTIKLVRNKYELTKYFNNHSGVTVIPSCYYDEYEQYNFNFPLIAKKVNGRSSEGLRVFESLEDFKAFKNLANEYIFQPKLNGPVFTVDLVRDSFGSVAIVPRKEKIRTSNGAGLSVEIVLNKKIIDCCQIIADELQFIGCMNFEFIETDGEYFLMDVNPRFSAGVSFSKLAGYDFVYNSIRAFSGEKIENTNSVTEIKAIKIFKDKIL
jgi:carbamoyl-phosphate synthase large subunit